MGLTKRERRNKIRKRVRKNITGTSERPRLSVFRSNNQIYAQLIDDIEGKTLVSASSLEKDIAEKAEIKKTQTAALVGQKLGERAKDAKLTSVVFDRGGYRYHGRVKALADSARKAGLKF